MRTQTLLVIALCVVLTQAWPWDKKTTGVYDEFSGLAYQSLSAEKKMAKLWKEITADKTPYGWYSLISFGRIFFEEMKPSFDSYSDVLPEDRNKYIHAVGCVAQAEFVAEKEGNPFTGVFQGASNVLIRMSTALEAKDNTAPDENFIPGMGIKLLRDGVPSANIVAMLGVDGQDSWNAWKYDWSNHIPNPTRFATKKLGQKFAEATPYIGRIGLKTWGKYDQTGKETTDASLKIPYKLVFKATSATKNMFPDSYQDKFINQLQTIPNGTNLWDVYVVQEPATEPFKIGTLKLKSKFTTSKFGDKHLFFQHSYIEDDIQLHPNWKKALEQDPPLMAKLMEKFHK